MKIKGATCSQFTLEYQGVAFDVVKTQCESTVELIGTTWGELAVNTNTHPEALLELISETIYRFNQKEKAHA
jgi:hypothetical protein